MGFELRVVRNNPLMGVENIDAVVKEFLKQIDYLPEAFEDDAGFHLFRDCFLEYPDKPWTIDELLTVLDTNRATLYRYLNKLKGLDILDEVPIPIDQQTPNPSRKTKKGYRFRFSSLSLAWALVESHTNVAMQNYRLTVDHIDALSRKERERKGTFSSRSPKVTVDALVLRGKGKARELLLVKRGREPFLGLWALPGGFVEYGERTEDAVLREVEEEAGLKCEKGRLLLVVSEPGRDPRGHTISLLYGLETGVDDEPHPGDDASETAWFKLTELPKLAFDHERMVEEGLKKMG